MSIAIAFVNTGNRRNALRLDRAGAAEYNQGKNNRKGRSGRAVQRADIRYHLEIRNVRWIEPNGKVVEGTIVAAGGALRLFPGRRSAGSQRCRTLDGTGLLAIPGLIDAHTHMRQPGQRYKEGILNGTKAAVRGGVTTVLDMPNNVPPCTTAARLQAKRELFGRLSLTSWGLFLHATPHGPFPEMERCADAAGAHAGRAGSFVGVKVYMARSSSVPAILDVDRLAAIFAHFPVVAIHAEDETRFLPPGAMVDGRWSMVDGGSWATPHHMRRPVEAVASALDRIERALLSVPEKKRCRLVLAHVTTELELEWVRKMKRSGFDLFVETCPHYCLFTAHDAEREGAALKVNPPLRTERDRQAIVEGLADGTIDLLSSDHAPHAPWEKSEREGGAPRGEQRRRAGCGAHLALREPLRLRSSSPRAKSRGGTRGAAVEFVAPPEAPSGIGGIEWMAPLLATFVQRGWIDWRRAVELSCAGPARCYGISGRDGLRDGNWADVVLLREALPRQREVLRCSAGERGRAHGLTGLRAQDDGCLTGTAEGSGIPARRVGDGRVGGPSPARPITEARYDPYRGIALAAEVVATIVNGKVLFERGAFDTKAQAGVDIVRGAGVKR